MIMNTHGNALDLNIHIDGTPLDNVNSTKYLGVYLTSTLSWHDHTCVYLEYVVSLVEVCNLFVS